MIQKITTQEEYNNVRHEVDRLIDEATGKGMLEPDMDNEYTRKIASLSRLMAAYENDSLGLQTLRVKSPLIKCIEDYGYAHNMRQKDVASALGVNESVFSQIMNGKRKITMSIAKRLHSVLGIDANTILDFA
ncbi:helix-turn-helix domain-containing protein [uncultured Prevotella sp.]|jgi:HTH-type transcriptional regulator/antitoxin HigA|uniref:helix-turn-helix domain-containing protein n=1 Tax=uncultured Prevotella sp. TaxID=159272 RepID=UPI00259A64F3|nr:helix-turn-helix domain-containing protein [uncultured Prevotella sp.]